MYKALLLLPLLFISCIGTGVQMQQHSTPIVIDKATAIPQNMALDYARSYNRFNGSLFHKAEFQTSYVTVNREGSLFRGFDAIKNKDFNYTDLVLFPDTIHLPNNDSWTRVSLIHKDKLNAPDLYTSWGAIEFEYCIYVWTKKSHQMTPKNFQKFLNALVSLGVQVPNQQTQTVRP